MKYGHLCWLAYYLGVYYLYAWIFYHTDEQDEKTKKVFKVPKFILEGK
jgi:hypothetical protein